MRALRKIQDQEDEKLEAVVKIGSDIIDRVELSPRGGYYTELSAYMAQLKPFPVLKSDEEYTFLFEQYAHGDEKQRLRSRDLLVYGNIRLVLSIAMRYTSRGLPLLDMLQEGVIGLMRAIPKYDISSGYRFSTYATWWIRQGITRALCDKGDDLPYRLPVHYRESLTTVKFAFSQLFLQFGRVPKTIEIYAWLKKSGKKNAERLSLADVTDLHHAMLTGKSTLRLDAPASESGDESEDLINVLDVVPAKTETVVEARRLHAEYRKALNRIMDAVDTLPPRSAMVVRLRYGLGDFEPMTLEEIGTRYELTRERIRQIEAKALEGLEEKLGITSTEIMEIIDVIQDLEVVANAV